jgi:hypothetical protein
MKEKIRQQEANEFQIKKELEMRFKEEKNKF